ncbi:MAG: protein LphB [Legionella sp.]|nr:protein LphB [Legionella sp.]
MKSLISRSELFLASLLGIYSIYYLMVSLSVVWGFTTDDAYISLLYARQLADGKGLYWHELMPLVEGYSNFLWVLIASAVIKLQCPLVCTMKWISVFSLGLGLIFLYRLGRLFFSPLLAILPVFLFSHYSGVAWWTVSGLESLFFCALSLLLIWQVAAAFGYTATSEQQKTSTSAWIIANSALLLLSLTRFEGLIWVIPVAFFIICQVRSSRLNELAFDYKKVYLWGLISFGCFVFPYALYFIWRLSYFGHWIPNSYRCKAFVQGQVAVVDLNYLRMIIPLIVAALPYFLASKDCRHLLLWVPSVLYALMLWKADPILAHHLRLFLGPFALFTLLSVLGVSQFLGQFKLSSWHLKLVTSLVIMVMTFLFIPDTHFADLRVTVANYQARSQNRLALAKLLNAQAGNGATVLLGDIGLIPFSARPDIRFIDSQCLNNAALTQAPYNNNLALYAAYLQKQVKPDWVIVVKPLYEAHLDFLVDLLEKNKFLRQYQLVGTLESGAVVPGIANHSKKMTDYVYLLYKRK